MTSICKICRHYHFCEDQHEEKHACGLFSNAGQDFKKEEIEK